MSNISEEEKLAWGDYDFIEESTSFSSTPLNFEEVSEVAISEAKSSEKSPFKLIGRVCGCIAPIDCMSRNGRLYEASHWPKILSNPELQERIASRKFFGMISHENCPINDRNFKAGEISHICSLLEVRNDDNGKPYLYGELDILDTPAGRILKAMYEGGAGLYVSTRAAGRLLESTRDGRPIKVVDPSNYYINSIDFVLNPGFLQAKPAFEAVSTEVPQPQLHESVEETSQPITSTTSEELTTLKSQIDKLAKIVEKVVDDVYEEPTSESISDELEKRQDLSAAKKDQLQAKAEVAQKAEEEAAAKREGRSEQEILDKRYKTANKEGEYATHRRQNASEALVDFVNLMASTNISEEKFGEILDIIAASKKENK